MPERPSGSFESSGIAAGVSCFNCESSSTELVQMETPALAGARIYRCSHCGHVDWLELPPGKRP